MAINSSIYMKHCTSNVSMMASAPVRLDSHSDEALAQFGHALEAIPEVHEAFLMSGDYERLLRKRLYKIPGMRHS